VFLLPFVCYAYLPIRAAQHPPLNWTNPSTWDRFLDHVLASQYAHFALHHTAAQMMEQGVKLLPQVLSASIWLSLALALIGLPFIAWGWVVWYRRQPLVALHELVQDTA
jgi:hypothetical protein